MTTTREKFRARRAARKVSSFYRGTRWRPIDIHRMRQLRPEPLRFNPGPRGAISLDELRAVFERLDKEIREACGIRDFHIGTQT